MSSVIPTDGAGFPEWIYLPTSGVIWLPIVDGSYQGKTINWDTKVKLGWMYYNTLRSRSRADLVRRWLRCLLIRWHII